jgi:hypothetical protein
MMKNEDGEKPVVIKSTSNKVGISINVGELLEALKNEAFNNEFKDKAPVFLHEASSEGKPEPLTAVYVCGSCDKLHLDAGYDDTAHHVLGKKSIIYQDYRNQEQQKFISRAELIDILERIQEKKKPVGICTTFDNGANPLTEVLKCSPECEAVHLITGYKSNAINEN